MRGYKLKINSPVSLSSDSSNLMSRIYMDNEDNLLSKDHQYYYIIIKLGASSTLSSCRLYLSLDKQIEYYKARKKRGDLLFRSLPQRNRLQLLDKFPNNKEYIFNIIDKIIISPMLESTVSTLIYGLNLHLLACQENKILLANDLSNINTREQRIIIDYLVSISINKTGLRSVGSLYSHIERAIPTFKNTLIFNFQSENILAIPSTVIFQLDYYARKELDEAIAKAREYQLWMKEFEKIDLFSLKNLARTYYERRKILKSASGGFNRVLNSIAKQLHCIDLALLRYSLIDKEFYILAKIKSKVTIDEMEAIINSGGINIEYMNSERMYSFWHKELSPNYPIIEKVQDKYTFIFSKLKYFREKYSRVFGEKIREHDTRMMPDLNILYNLILFLLIREV